MAGPSAPRADVRTGPNYIDFNADPGQYADPLSGQMPPYTYQSLPLTVGFTSPPSKETLKAIRMWNTLIGQDVLQVVLGADAANSADILIDQQPWNKSDAAYTMGQAAGVNREPEWGKLSGIDQTTIVLPQWAIHDPKAPAHELGHALGLGHPAPFDIPISSAQEGVGSPPFSSRDESVAYRQSLMGYRFFDQATATPEEVAQARTALGIMPQNVQSSLGITDIGLKRQAAAFQHQHQGENQGKWDLDGPGRPIQLGRTSPVGAKWAGFEQWFNWMHPGASKYAREAAAMLQTSLVQKFPGEADSSSPSGKWKAYPQAAWNYTQDQFDADVVSLARSLQAHETHLGKLENVEGNNLSMAEWLATHTTSTGPPLPNVDTSGTKTRGYPESSASGAPGGGGQVFYNDEGPPKGTPAEVHRRQLG